MSKRGAALVWIVAIWGFYYLAIHALLESGWDPHFMNAVRFSLGGALLAAVAILTGQGREMVSLQRRFPWQVPVVSFVGVLLCIGALTLGQQTVSSGISGVMVSTAPLFTALLGLLAFFGSERLGKKGWAGVLSGLLGVVLIYAPWSGAGADSLGVLLLLVGSASLALEAHLFARWFQKESVLPLTALLVLWAGAMFFVLSALTEDWSTGSWPLLILLAVFSNAATYMVYLWLIRNSGPTFANIYNYLVPVVALVAGVAIAGEALGLLAVAGSALCLGGALLVGAGSKVGPDH